MFSGQFFFVTFMLFGEIDKVIIGVPFLSGPTSVEGVRHLRIIQTIRSLSPKKLLENEKSFKSNRVFPASKSANDARIAADEGLDCF